MSELENMQTVDAEKLTELYKFLMLDENVEPKDDNSNYKIFYAETQGKINELKKLGGNPNIKEIRKILDDEYLEELIFRPGSTQCPHPIASAGQSIFSFNSLFQALINNVDFIEQLYKFMNNSNIPAEFTKLTEIWSKLSREGNANVSWQRINRVAATCNIKLCTLANKKELIETIEPLSEYHIISSFDLNTKNKNDSEIWFEANNYLMDQLRAENEWLKHKQEKTETIEGVKINYNTYTIKGPDIEADDFCINSFITTIYEKKNNTNVLKILKGEKDMKKECKKLLEANHNLILTGAPGTGKTYLAREIAKEMDAEIEFVQFHPSYDYTDFVEGLRPVEDGDEIGFKLEDGIFKKFCKKALKNLADSQKQEDQLIKENNAKYCVIEFINKSLENATAFTLKSGNKFTISGYDENSIILNIPANEKTSTLKISLSDITTLIENDIEIKQVKDIRDFFKRIWSTQADSYIFALYNSGLLNKTLKPEEEIKKITKKNFVFIIDEINRAEISKVFGELFFALDPGYRVKAEDLHLYDPKNKEKAENKEGKLIQTFPKTQYANLHKEDDPFKDGFYIPENVYIIGTMNNIDRSVESFDFAMRRRFAWKEIPAPSSKNSKESENYIPITMWSELDDDIKKQAKKRIISLNNEIAQTEGLGKDFQIGPSYFLKLQESEYNFNKLWDLHLESLLSEYVRGLPDADIKLTNLKKAYELKTAEENTETTDNSEISQN